MSGKLHTDLEQIAEELRARGLISEEEAAEVKTVLLDPQAGGLDPGLAHEEDENKLGERESVASTIAKADEGDIRKLIKEMTLPQKMKAAMFGNSICRLLLISDSNRLVQEAVLKNPQIQEREVVEFAKNKNLSEFVLRRIGNSKSWMKGYTIKLNLVMNPKCPIDMALKWLKHLRIADLKRVASTKGVSQVVVTSARKRVADSQKR